MDFLQSLHAALNVVPVSKRVLTRPGTTDQLKHVLDRLIAGPDSAPPMIKSWLGTNYPTTQAYIAVDHEWYLAVEAREDEDGWHDLLSATSLQDNTSFFPPIKNGWSHKWEDIPTLVPLAELPEPEDDEDSYDEDEDSWDEDEDEDADADEEEDV